MKKLGLLFLLSCLIFTFWGCHPQNNIEHEEDDIAGIELEELTRLDRPQRQGTVQEPDEAEVLETPDEPELEEEEEPEPEDFFLDEETISSIQHDARYWFEQFVVADMVDALGDEITESLRRSEERFLLNDVLMAWHFTADIIILENLHLLEEAGLDADLGRDDITDELRVTFGLGDDHIVDSWVEVIDENTNAFIFQLYDLVIPRTSIYMAIAYNDVAGLRIFTLEDIEGVSRRTGEFMFCFVAIDSRGSFYAIEGNREAFILAIYDAMVNLTEPAVTQRR